MESAESGSTVKVHYTGKLDNGMIFDSSREREPLAFTIGAGNIIAGFESAVVGMTVGDTKTVRIPASEAYGAHREELVISMDRNKFPDHIEPKEGLLLKVKQPDGGMMNVKVTSIEEEVVQLDANHPLAGLDLTFDIELIAIG